MSKFDLERFMSFKVNTVAVRNEYGGCIKCAALYALGGEHPISQGWHSGEYREKFNKFGGWNFVRLMRKAEDLLIASTYPNNFEANSCLPEDEARIKKFVIEGMVELGLIEAAKEIEYVQA